MEARCLESLPWPLFSRVYEHAIHENLQAPIQQLPALKARIGEANQKYGALLMRAKRQGANRA